MSLTPVFAPVSQPAVTVDLRANSTITTDLTDYSGQFDGIAIGTADVERYVVVSIAGQGTASRTVSTVTIGGISATLAVAEESDAGNYLAEIWYAAVPTGTTADIDIVFSGTMSNCGIAVWEVVNPDTSPFATASDPIESGQVLSASLNIPADGICVGVAMHNGTTGTWAGIDEDVAETELEGPEWTAASKAFTTAQTPQAVTMSMGGSGSAGVMVLASWGT